MKLHYMGSFQGKVATLPHAEPVEDAVPVREPGKPRKLVIITNIGALVLFAILLALLLLQGGTAALNFRGVILAAVLLFPRELLRSVFYRGDVYYYTNFQQSMPFVIGPEHMRRERFLLMTLAPDVLLGLLPYLLFLIWPRLSLLGTLGLICLPMGFGDYLLAWLILRQMPKGAMTYRNMFHSYWYIP